jgi:hypothetical protein
VPEAASPGGRDVRNRAQVNGEQVINFYRYRACADGPDCADRPVRQQRARFPQGDPFAFGQHPRFEQPARPTCSSTV